MIADFTLSIDNILAVAGAAGGHLLLLVFGLSLSIPILMLGSALLAELLNRWPWLNWLGALVIVWAGAKLIDNDPRVRDWLSLSFSAWLALGLAATAAIWLAYSVTRRGEAA